MKIICLFLIMLPIRMISQNLVLNPSFETTYTCPTNISAFGQNFTDWSTPTAGSTDIFSSCEKSQVGVPVNYNGYQKPMFGNNYAGCYFYAEENYREYPQGKLSSTLEKGEKYKVSFYVSLAESSDFAINNIDFLFSNKQISTTLFSELSERELRKNDVEDYSLYEIDSAFYVNKDDWILISKEITAIGNENFISIGNFEKNNKTEIMPVPNGKNKQMSYYYIDMVSVEPVNGKIPEIVSTIPITTEINQEEDIILAEPEIEFDKTYIFKNVVFDFNSTELSEEAKNEIEFIYNFLKKNSNAHITITGHTDNVGTDNFNQILSENRAKSVAGYLVELGVNNSRIQVFGLGNKQPITTNKTEEGRSQNRRVEFKIRKMQM